MVAPVPLRGDVWLVGLDPTVGREIRKTRPCLVVSPDELNRSLTTVIVAPLTTGGHAYPFRVPIRVQRKAGFVVLDQLRTVDRVRLLKRVGRGQVEAVQASLGVLRAMFAE